MSTSPSQTDRIERQIDLKAPISRVWRALTDAKEFGSWFGVVIEGDFVEGQRSRGRITHAGYEHLPFEILIERLEPERHFVWRWHPHAIDPEVDYSTEEETRVAFELTEIEGGTRLRVVESGFDRIPLARRASAFAGNSGGWSHQMVAIEHYLARG